MSAATSLDRRRAAHALAAIEAMKRHADIGHYVSYVKGLPASILQAGLGQALGTLGANAKLGEPTTRLSGDALAKRSLYEQVAGWLAGDHADAPYRAQANIWTAITQGSEAGYVHAQAEALAYLTWLKKFAVAFLPEANRGDGR